MVETKGPEQQPVVVEGEKSLEKPGSETSPRSVGEIQKDLDNTVKEYVAVYKAIEQSSMTTQMLAANVRNPNLKGMDAIRDATATLDEREEAAMREMSKLGEELNNHPDKPVGLPDFSVMSPIGISRHHGHTM